MVQRLPAYHMYCEKLMISIPPQMSLVYNDGSFSFTLHFNADIPVQAAAFFHVVIQRPRIHLSCRDFIP